MERNPHRAAPPEVLTLIQENKGPMRSRNVFKALQNFRNRYMLCQLASKATRRFHRPNTRIQETMNEVLERIGVAERRQVVSEPEKVAAVERRAA